VCGSSRELHAVATEGRPSLIHSTGNFQAQMRYFEASAEDANLYPVSRAPAIFAILLGLHRLSNLKVD
jgi:hypothetical protein